jgi:hypothetical protein
MGVVFESLRVGLKDPTAVYQHRFQGGQVGEGAIGDRLINQCPEALGGL